MPADLGDVFTQIPGFIGGAVFTTIVSYLAQRQLADRSRRHDDIAIAWDSLLKPLYESFHAARWNFVAITSIDAAYAYARRWDAGGAKVNERLREVSTHRLSKLIQPEIDAVRDWIDAESALASIWNQALHTRGSEGRALFAYLVHDTSLPAAGFKEGEARAVLGAVGNPAPADWVIANTVRLAENSEIWAEAKAAAETYRESAFRTERLWNAVDASLAKVLPQPRIS